MSGKDRPRRRPRERDQSVGSPAQQDEADIVSEAGAERDESGELLTDEASILKLGAVDADSVRENRRLEHIVNQKRAGVKDVPFNAGDILTKYETIIKYWPPNTLDIGMKRLTGSPVQHVITSRPRSAPELYAELMALHGQHEEAKYEIKIYDSNGKEFRGSGQVTLPDTRPKQGHGPIMTNPQYPYGYPPQYPPPPPQGQAPPGYPPPYATPQYPPAPQAAPAPQPQQAQSPAPQAPPPYVIPAGPDPVEMMRQLFTMFQQMRESLAATSAVPPPPPPPPSHADPGAMVGWMQQMFQMFQQMQPQPQPPSQQPARRGEPQQPQMQFNPMMMGMGVPPMTPPPGMMWIPGFGFAPIERIVQAFSGGSGPGGSGPQGPMYRRPSYGPSYPGGYGGGGGGGDERSHQPGPHYPPQAPARPQTAADQFKESLAFMRMASDAVTEFSNLMGGNDGGRAPEPQQAAEAEDSPVQIIDAGPAKIVVNKEDGSLRAWETGFANMDKIFKWFGEQREAIQRANVDAERARAQAVTQQLPPGHVLVTPGYQPPPGFVAVPIEQPPPRSDLPHPPAHVPPPIESTPAPRRTWQMPPMPESE